MPSETKSKGETGGFLSLAPHCALKRLESPCLYDIREDELYDLDEEAFSYLASSPPLDPSGRSADAEALVGTCLDEGLCEVVTVRQPRALPAPAPSPSLRYLLVHITGRCNLRCRHCFQGEADDRELGLEELAALAGEFADLQGLRFIVSGGEPLLHSRFWELNARVRDFPFRSILLTNGTLLDGDGARRLRFHEVQVSIDGLEGSHDLIRGKGSFRKAVRGLEELAAAGIDLSVATMVHGGNLDEFEKLRQFLEPFPLRSWSVDVPCLTGNLAANRSLAAAAAEGASKIDYSFGGGYYGSSGTYACGAHLAAVMANGSICKCGHFSDRPEGRLEEGLAAVWTGMRRYRLNELTCRCSHIESCRGGCRYRAEFYSCLYNPDPIQCFRRGVPVGGDRIHVQKVRDEHAEGG